MFWYQIKAEIVLNTTIPKVILSNMSPVPCFVGVHQICLSALYGDTIFTIHNPTQVNEAGGVQWPTWDFVYNLCAHSE